jgi:hypothetical protein
MLSARLEDGSGAYPIATTSAAGSCLLKDTIAFVR